MRSYLAQTEIRAKKVTFSKIIHSSSNKRTLQSFIAIVSIDGTKLLLHQTTKEESLGFLLIYLPFLLCEIGTCTASAFYQTETQG